MDPAVQDLNILLLGESGVGKSTFINACFNYLKFNTLSDLLNDELEVLIPAKFELFDKNLDEKIVEVGVNHDQNECLEPGKAATQTVKTYVFNMEIGEQKYKVNLLDTPGMGDARGVDRDQRNCELILAHIAHMKKIHAFCILLKPGDARLSIFKSYCIVQILSRLDSAAVKNFVFAFTNSRGENFSPGKTFASLKVLLKDIKEKRGIDIPAYKSNIFCFDNESFRYAAAIKKGVMFEEQVFSFTEASWKHSHSEFWRLILYVMSQPPFDLKKTISINDAKIMASQLSEPATEIVKLIDDNLKILNERKKEVSDAKMTQEQLRKKMYTPYIDMKVVTLDGPTTVCTNKNCIKIYTVNNMRKTHYAQKCCRGNGDGCLVSFLTAEIVGDPGLWICHAFDFFGNCRKCPHSLKEHQHIYYETKVYERDHDESMLPVVNSQDELVQAKESLLKEIETRLKEYEYEREFILRSCAMFDHYLKEQSIIPIGNPIEQYLQYQITRESSFQSGDNNETLNDLIKLKVDYEEQKKRVNTEFPAGVLSPDDIQNRKTELLNLKHFGPKIRELFEAHAAAIDKELKKKEVSVNKGRWFKKAWNYVTK